MCADNLKGWGVENLTIPKRHYGLIKDGVKQFGGNKDKQPVLEDYQMGVAEFREPASPQFLITLHSSFLQQNLQCFVYKGVLVYQKM